MEHYYILTGVSNLKTDDDSIEYYVCPRDGGAIKFTMNTLEDAIDYINSVGGILDVIYWE